MGALSVACALTDSKDATCSADEMYEAESGDRYCFDETASAECEHVMDEIIDAFVTCGEGAFTESELRDELEKAGVNFPCDEAVATTGDLDTCYAQLADPTCDGNLAVISDECSGAVLVEA